MEENNQNPNIAQSPNINHPTISANTKTVNGIVYFLVACFFDVIGIHKFIASKPGIGILYIFAIGLSGIGWFIDWTMAIVYLAQMDENSDIHFGNDKYVQIQKNK